MEGPYVQRTGPPREGVHDRMPIAFLDRDGVINKGKPGYVNGPEEVHLLDGAAKVIGDLNTRRAQILDTELQIKSSTQVVKAYTPLAQMFGYVKSLRSFTQGRANYSMEFSHYSGVPSNIAEEILTN